MFRSIFHPDSPLMITINQLTDCIFLSLFWLLGCFPVVTIGVSFAALYDAVYYGFRRGDKHAWQRFGRSFRQNLKPGIVPTLIFLAFAGCLGWGMIQVWNNAVYGNLSWGVFAGAAFVSVVLTGVSSILFPMLSRFENTTAVLFANTFRLGIAHMPRTLALGILNTVTAALCLRYIYPLFFLPAVAALISTLFIEPILKPYMPEEDAA